MLQVLRQYVRSAKQQSVMQRKEKKGKVCTFQQSSREPPKVAARSNSVVQSDREQLRRLAVCGTACSAKSVVACSVSFPIKPPVQTASARCIEHALLPQHRTKTSLRYEYDKAQLRNGNFSMTPVEQGSGKNGKSNLYICCVGLLVCITEASCSDPTNLFNTKDAHLLKEGLMFQKR